MSIHSRLSPFMMVLAFGPWFVFKDSILCIVHILEPFMLVHNQRKQALSIYWRLRFSTILEPNQPISSTVGKVERQRSIRSYLLRVRSLTQLFQLILHYNLCLRINKWNSIIIIHTAWLLGNNVGTLIRAFAILSFLLRHMKYQLNFISSKDNTAEEQQPVDI